MSSDTRNTTCCTAEEHQGHLCELENQQEWDIIRQVTDSPTVKCGNCGNLANAARNVCIPEEL